MTYTRWYDEDRHLKLIIETLEQMQEDMKLSMAHDLIEMIIQGKYPDTDRLIQQINDPYIPVRRRWYDRNETIHSAVEMLKYIDKNEKNDILKEILYALIRLRDEQYLENYKKDDLDK